MKVASIGFILAALLAAAAPLAVRAQDGAAATVEVVAPSKKVSASADDVAVEIAVRDVENLAGFSVVLSFDPNVLRLKSIEKTDYLGSTGREIVCPDATMEDSAVRYSCVTLRDKPDGVTGGGTLAIAHFEAAGEGTTSLDLSRVQLAQPDGTEIAYKTVSGRLTVAESAGWFTPLRIALLSAAAVVLVAAGGTAAWAYSSRRAAAPRAGADAP